MPDYRQEAIDRLLKHSQEVGADEEALDEVVHDLKGREAADINNGGLRGQLDYLLQSGTAEVAIKEWLTPAAAEHNQGEAMKSNAAAGLGEELTAEVDAMIKDSRVLPAVKMVRERLDWDLLSARDAVYARRAVLGLNPAMELARGSDLAKFKEFFKKMGVRQAPMKTSDHEDQPDEYGSVMAITVTQAHFCFDEHGRYVGVLADEMGGFDERIPDGR